MHLVNFGNMLSALVFCLALSIQPQKSAMFVSEYTSREQFRFANGVLDIRRGNGWLRTPRVYSNFRLSLEFRPVTPDAEMNIVLRVLTSLDEIFEPAYRVTAPPPRDTASAVIRGPDDAIRLVEEGRVQWISGEGVWQRLEIVALLDDITVTLNDNLVAAYKVDKFAGYILFTSRRGHLQMRNVKAGEVEPTFVEPAGTLTDSEVTAAGGTGPRRIKEVKPFYSIEALHRRKVTGVVRLKAVVLPDGAVGSVRVTASLDPDLDQSAVAAVRQWKFRPGMVNGSAIPVLIDVEMRFAITG